MWHYAELHQTFPHQSAADQRFDELQFESYRALGGLIGDHAAEQIGEAVETALAKPAAGRAAA